MMYSNLYQQTPRRFLQDVIFHIYSNYIKNDDFLHKKYFSEFPLNWENPLHEEQLKRIDSKNFEKISTLIIVWGNGTLTKKEKNGIELVGGLPKEVFSAFSLPFISVSEEDTTEEGNRETIDETITKAETETTKPPPTKPQPDVFINAKNGIEEWYRGGALKGFQKIRDELVEFILTFIDWDSENISHQIVQNMLPTKGSFGIEGQVFSQSNVVYLIKKNNKSRFAFLAIAAYLYLGEKTWNFSDAADYQLKLCDFVISIKNELIESICLPKKKLENKYWPINEWIVLNDFYLNILCENINSGDELNTIYKKMCNLKLPELGNIHSEQWNNFLSQLYKKDIKNNHELFLRFFNCTQTDVTRISSIFFLDAQEILSILEKYNNHKFDLEKFDFIPDSSGIAGNILANPLNILNFIKQNIYKVVDEELRTYTKIVNDFKKIFDGEIKKDNIEKIILMAQELYKTLLGTNEFFDQLVFDPFIGADIDILELVKLINKFNLIEKVDNLFDRLIFCSTFPIKKLKRYYDNFLGLDNFLDTKLPSLAIVEQKTDDADLKNEINAINRSLNDIKKMIENFYEQVI